MLKLKHQQTGQTVHASRVTAERLREEGWENLSAPGQGDADVHARSQASPAEDIDGAPAQSAPKSDWVAYAKAQGVEDADDLTKAELVERLGD